MTADCHFAVVMSCVLICIFGGFGAHTFHQISVCFGVSPDPCETVSMRTVPLHKSGVPTRTRRRAASVAKPIAQDDADDNCIARFKPYVGADYMDSSLNVSYFYPSDASWEQGDREIICVLYDLSYNKLTASVKGTGV